MRRPVPLMVIVVLVVAVVASAGWGQHLYLASRRSSPPATVRTNAGSTYSAHLVAGPRVPVPGDVDVAVDLRARILRLDPTLSVQIPDDLLVGGFRDLDGYLRHFSLADRAGQRSFLLGDHFEGSVSHTWASTTSSKRYHVDLIRFQTPRGALRHLSEFAGGSLHMAEGMRPTQPSVHGGLAFLDRRPEVLGSYRELTEYFARGRYFGYVRVQAKTDVTVSELQKDGDLLTQAQSARTPKHTGPSIGA